MFDPKIKYSAPVETIRENRRLIYRSIFNDLLREKVEENGDSLEDIVGSTLTYKEIASKCDTDNLPAFTVWTKEWVYFPATYDGSEWIDSVRRNPSLTPTDHIGG